MTESRAQVGPSCARAGFLPPRSRIRAALLQTNPQFQARGYFEAPEHPVVGPMPLPSLPFRYASIDRWLRKPAPTIGQHNERVLCGILALSPAELRDLEAEGVIGTRPRGL